MEHIAKSVVDITDSPVLTHGLRAIVDMDSLPGEYVMKYRQADSDLASDHAFEFCIKRVVPGKHTAADDNRGLPYIVGYIPYRKVSFTGYAIEEVIGSMFFGLAMLARNGSINPEQPEEPGDPPIQHAMHILAERLKWQVEARHGLVEDKNLTSNLQSVEAGLRNDASTKMGRCAEIIAALGTAIAALARVKDL